ncbi:hypothetical protein BX661DRAFT_185538 [Kickxella alabastrina]|uniref:uncharacterized protein n=1 Tax=Kickxella alabastrina TaxID=61397 RepID=UPI00221E48C3|nr:uncharacterized protein BX661DRAFT_185538 [Kickxella alabastrina]KAI7824562.1 hypothetical protein BX661DRAFT_185538 [Kickxella alabastrina]
MMESTKAKRTTGSFTARPRPANTRFNSNITSRTASPTTRSPQTPTPSSAVPTAEATTWQATKANRTLLVGSTSNNSMQRISSTDPLHARNISIDSTIVFQGIVDICVLHGQVSVYEYAVGAQWVRVYSPSSHPLVSIRAVAGCEPQVDAQENNSNDIVELQELWKEHVSLDTAGVGSASIVAIRSVSCGLDSIGSVAPPYRNLFTPDSLPERVSAGQPRGSLKRRLNQTPMAMDTDATYDSDTEMMPVDEYAVTEQELQAAIGVPGFYPISHITPDMQLLQVPQDWMDTLDLASKAPLQLDDGFEPISPVYVMAGAQGQGKSTFTRQLINRLLGRFGRVFYMETDIGQSELSPPGALSLAMLQAEPLHAVYMGVVSPKNDPDRYVKAIGRLASVYRDHMAGERAQQVVTKAGKAAKSLDHLVVPLVVNTQGWLKGLGLDLHYSLCETVQPTNYIQLHDAAATQQENQLIGDSGNGVVPFIDFSSISGRDPRLTWISAMSYDRATLALRATPAAATTSTAAIGSVDDSEPQPILDASRKGPKLMARDMRDLSLISHFYASSSNVQQLDSPQWDMHQPLASQTPLVIPWKDLVVWLGEEDIPASQFLRALNGTLVGLVCVSKAPNSTNAHTWTDGEIKGLYAGNQGVTDHGALQLSEPGSRALLRSQTNNELPQIVYGHPNVGNTTFLAHAFVRSVDPATKSLHVLVPPLVKGSSGLVGRIVGFVKGPGPSAVGVEMPMWAIIDGGYAARAIGSSAAAAVARGKFGGGKRGSKKTVADEEDSGVSLGIQEAPYLSVDFDGGIAKTRSGPLRRTLQQ